MSIDWKTHLERWAKASRTLRDTDTPDHLRTLAKKARDTADVLLGLQDAMVRKVERAKVVPAG